MRRRQCLLGLVSALPLVSGCSTLPDALGDSPTPPTYESLERTPVYVAPAVSLSLPDGVPRVDAPEDAELVVLPATTDVEPAKALDWLVSGAGVALVGDGSEATLRRWKSSPAYEERFEPSEGGSDSSPNPDLLVAFAVDRDYITTHRYTWGHTDAPSDEELLDALEDALTAEASRTPHA